MRRFFALVVGLCCLAATNNLAAAGDWHSAEPCCGGGYVAPPYVGPAYECEDVCSGAVLVNQGQYHSPEPFIPVGVYPYWYRYCYDSCTPYIPPLPHRRYLRYR